MGDWGIKLSQVGEDADGGDKTLIFSSSWKLLNIIKEVSFTNLAAGATIYEHGLGYTPLFLPYTNQRFMGSAAGVASFNHTFGARVKADATKIYLQADAPNGTGRVIVTPIDITKDYASRSVNRETKTKKGIIDRDYGIKVVLEGKDINSKDTRDFAIHSGTRTPMIHMIQNFTTVQTRADYTVTHNLGYPPFFLVYGNLDTNPGWQIVGTSNDVQTTSTNTTVTARLGYPGKLAMVIFKDPLVF